MGKIVGSRLGARDAVYVYGDAANGGDTPSIMTTLCVFDAREGRAAIESREEAVAWILEHVQRVPALRRRLQRIPRNLDYPYWVETEIDPDHHIRFREIGQTTRGDLHRLLASIAQPPFDLDRPLWDIHVLAGIRGVADMPDRATVVLLRVHHSVTDGKGLMQAVRALFGDPDAESVLAVPDRAVPGVVSAALKVPVHYLRFSTAILRWMNRRRSLGALIRAGTITMPVAHRPRTRFNVVDEGPRQFGRIRMSLADVRALARATGTTVNDVALAIVSDAVRAYLGERGEEPAASLAAEVPVSLAGRGELTSANRTAVVYVDLHTDEADALTRLHLIHESAAQEKDRVMRPESVAAEPPFDYCPSVGLDWAIRRAVRRAVHRKAAPSETDTGATTTGAMNTGVSNVAFGALTGLHFGDSPAVDIFGVACLNRHYGLMHGAGSVGDTFNVNFSSKEALMPDPTEYERLLERAFTTLRDAVASRPGGRTELDSLP